MKRAPSKVTLALLAAATFSAPAAASTESKIWQFDVLLDGKPIGYHNFSLADAGDQRVLETEASFAVKFLFVTAFRYRHENIEIWSDNCLQSIDAMTNSNGKQISVSGTSGDERFELQQPQGNELPACVQSFAYWNPAVLNSTQLLNAQTGQYEKVTATFEREETIDVAGEPVSALRYSLETRGGDITLWYSNDNQTWLALEAPAKGGRTLAYRPTRVPLSESDAFLAQND